MPGLSPPTDPTAAGVTGMHTNLVENHLTLHHEKRNCDFSGGGPDRSASCSFFCLRDLDLFLGADTRRRDGRAHGGGGIAGDKLCHCFPAVVQILEWRDPSVLSSGSDLA